MSKTRHWAYSIVATVRHFILAKHRAFALKTGASSPYVVPTFRLAWFFVCWLLFLYWALPVGAANYAVVLVGWCMLELSKWWLPQPLVVLLGSVGLFLLSIYRDIAYWQKQGVWQHPILWGLRFAALAAIALSGGWMAWGLLLVLYHTTTLAFLVFSLGMPVLKALVSTVFIMRMTHRLFGAKDITTWVQRIKCNLRWQFVWPQVLWNACILSLSWLAGLPMVGPLGWVPIYGQVLVATLLLSGLQALDLYQGDWVEVSHGHILEEQDDPALEGLLVYTMWAMPVTLLGLLGLSSVLFIDQALRPRCIPRPPTKIAPGFGHQQSIGGDEAMLNTHASSKI